MVTEFKQMLNFTIKCKSEIVRTCYIEKFDGSQPSSPSFNCRVHQYPNGETATLSSICACGTKAAQWTIRIEYSFSTMTDYKWDAKYSESQSAELRVFVPRSSTRPFGMGMPGLKSYVQFDAANFWLWKDLEVSGLLQQFNLSMKIDWQFGSQPGRFSFNFF